MTQAPYADIRRALSEALKKVDAWVDEDNTLRDRAGYVRLSSEDAIVAAQSALRLAPQLLADAQLGALVRAAAGDTVEVVARAICWDSCAVEGDCESICLAASACRGNMSESCRRDAKAAIRALRNLADQPKGDDNGRA